MGHIRTLLYDNFLDKSFEKRVKELHQVIRQAFFNDKNNPYTINDLERSLDNTIGRRSKIPGIVYFITKRARFLKKHENLSVLPPEVAEIKFQERDKFTNVFVTDFNIQAKINRKAKQVRVYYRYRGNEEFKMILLSDDGNSFDEAANDQIFGGTIAANGNENIEYYLVVENPLAVSFDPPNYMWELHTANLKILNQ